MADKPDILDYATPSKATRRTSGLAIVSLVVAVLGSPFAMAFVTHSFPRSLRDPARLLIFISPVVAMLMAVVAGRRIRKSQQLRGHSLATIAIFVALLWVAAYVLLIIVMMDFHGPS